MKRERDSVLAKPFNSFFFFFFFFSFLIFFSPFTYILQKLLQLIMLIALNQDVLVIYLLHDNPVLLFPVDLHDDGFDGRIAFDQNA